VAKRNSYDGRCSVCAIFVRANEGVLEAEENRRGYRILCITHAPPGALAPPRPVETSRLPSIHIDRPRK
jgi:predicted DCC family thiol-disulfide oxidoreductase YuxK